MKAKRIVMVVAVLVVVLAMALAIVACEETTYTVSLYAMGGYGSYGRVECTNNSDHTIEEGDYGLRYDYRYKESDHVSIEATAEEGYRFVGWYDEGDVLISESNSYSFEMGNSDITYIAKFEKLYTLQLKCNYSQSGSVSGEGEYAEGENVTITATANEGHKFVGWYVDGELITDSAEYTLTMGDSSITYTAKFKIDIDPNFNCTLLDNGTYRLDSLIDNTVKKLIIPNYITEIGKLECSLDTINYTGTLAQWCAMSGLGNIMGSNPTLYIAGERVADDLVIPDSVTIIGDYAFYNCYNLDSVIIPDSVRIIGDYAFRSCGNLQSVIIPDSVTIIGDYAFYNCRSLTSVTIPDSVTIIGSAAFYNCRSLTSVTIPDSVTSIGEYAFVGCKNLTSVTIPDSVASIGEYAFADCNALAEVYNLSSLKITKGSNDNGYVAYYARDVYNSLAEPSKLTRKDRMIFHTDGNNVTLVRYIGDAPSVTIPDSVTSINNWAFAYCYSFDSVTIPNSVTSIGEYVFFHCIGLTSITIPDSVISIGNHAFDSCDKLTSVTIGNGVTSIGSQAFVVCNSLTSVTIGNRVTSIGYKAFSGCSSLASVTIPNSVTSIGNQAFYGCKSLASVTIPNSVTSIGNHAFFYCSSLTSVIFENTSGWFMSESSDAISGADITVTDPSQNAKYLTDTYYQYYWKRG